MKGKEWSLDAIAYLKDNYLIMSATDIGKHLGVSAGAVRIKANRIGMKKPLLDLPPIDDSRKQYRARYREKCISEGRCPHCGKPCAPYSYCEEKLSKSRAQFMARGKFRRIEKKAAKKLIVSKTATGIVTRSAGVTVHRMGI